MARPDALERRLGYRFSDAGLLEQALTHRSFGARHNERLEFLGDGVLDCAVAQALYLRFPDLPEGKLTQMRAGLIRRETLAQLAEGLGVPPLLRTAADVPLTESVSADALEAVLGAVFLDGGYDAARDAVSRIFEPLLSRLDPQSVLKDAKTRLQEAMQAKHQRLPEYRVVAEKLSARNNVFEVECVLPDLGLAATGTGSSRQRAEQQAAAALLEKLG
ncbi:MAG: ribonuclease III [Clostridia bacterium]